jgi:hypothetical protein
VTDTYLAFRDADGKRSFLLLARFGYGATSELSLLSGVKLKSDFGSVRAAFDPERTSSPVAFCDDATKNARAGG